MTLFRNVIFLASFSVMLVPLNASAARLKGKLQVENPSQYTVLAIAKNGKARTATVSANGRFSINVQKNSTLHLIGTGNQYVGPIVAAKGRKAYTTYSGTEGDLGRVQVKTGFASVRYDNVTKLVNVRPTVTFNKDTGVRGSSKLGLVAAPASVQAQSTPVAFAQIGEDQDRDGLPEAVDIDDDGDLVLDVSDEDSANVTSTFDTEVNSTLRTTLVNSVNANISGVTETQIDTALTEGLILMFLFRNNSSATISSVNVDCGSLPYCAPGTGTGTLRDGNLLSLEDTPWVNYDTDSDGFPNLVTSVERPEVNIKPLATRSQLKIGDTMYFIANTSTGTVKIPEVLPFYFVTGPALKSLTAGGVTTDVTYPKTDGDTGTNSGNPFVLANSTVTFNFWRPQRPAVTGAESGTSVDNGNLRYGFTISAFGDNGVYRCKVGEYSSLSSTLAARTEITEDTTQAVLDTAADAAVDSANLLSFTVDFATCLTRQGIDISGRKLSLDLTATSYQQNQTSQTFHVQLP